MKECDFLVVGGGPSGMTFATAVGKKAKVVVVEEHEAIGEPVQCTGLVTPRVVEMAGARDTVLNRLRGGYFNFPGDQVVEVRGRSIKAVVVDRAAFDRTCAERAMDAGAEVAPGERFTDARIGANATAHCWDSRGSFNYTTKLIVGADGYKSNVAKTAGLGGPKDFVRGVQMDIEHREEEQDMLSVYLGKKVAPGFFAWKIPCGEMTRVGLCASLSYDAPMTYLGPLLKRLGLQDKERIRVISGMIPIGSLAQTYAERILVIGDAAAQTKPLSGGGLYTGMVAAGCAARTALGCLEEDDFSAEALSSYQEGWKAELGRELDRGLMIRKAYTKLSDRKLEEVGRILSREDVREVLAEGDIDSPAELAPKVLKTAPGLLRLAPSFLRALFSRSPPGNQI
ncbi:MAG: NAD(P)/FAD-dependent oxidoreductase [Methanomassiliicoccales archaeon]|nr:NAD(P)/FAD-dependent oxidoreductase [Methanomassiliicoccales archaeon]